MSKPRLLTTLQELVNEQGTVISCNEDYAVVGEWSDGNTTNQDRIGYFVSIDDSISGSKIVKADSTSEIRGVTIQEPGFASNADKSMYDSTGNLLSKYDYIGFAGTVSVIDDGTCTAPGRCMPSDEGIATPSSNDLGYQVLERIDSNHILILMEAQSDMISRIDNDKLGKILIPGVDYGDTLPEAGTPGRLFFKKVT